MTSLKAAGSTITHMKAAGGTVAVVRAAGVDVFGTPPPPPTPPTPYAHYDFHEGSGNAADLQAHLSDIVGATYSGTAISAGGSWTGTDAAFTSTGSWSICFDAHIAGFTGSETWFARLRDASNQSIFIYVINPVQRFSIYANATGDVNSGATGEVTTGDHKFVVTFNGTSVATYIDGVQTKIVTGNPGIPHTVPTNNSLLAVSGNWPSGNLIYDLQIWDVALTMGEVAAL